MKESNYVRYRKLKALVNSLSYYVCRIFPIKNNLITVCSFEGKGGFGCNPKYIVQELHKRHPEYEFIWFVNKEVINYKKFPNFIKKVPNTFWRRAYWLSQSKIWIDNYRKPLGTCKREKQIYINTWHGCIGFKAIGLWREEGFSEIARMVSQADSNMIDYLLIDSEWTRTTFKKGMLYYGKMEKIGQPRCDVLFGDRKETCALVRKELNINSDKRILLYAPTYRENNQNTKRVVSSTETNLNLDNILNSLHSKYGGDWVAIVKNHPQLTKNTCLKRNNNDNRIYDASLFDDTNILIAASDIIITDFSSIAFEAAEFNIPVFLYIDDLEKYEKDRGSLFFEMKYGKPIVPNKKVTPDYGITLPFCIAQNEVELIRNIKDFVESDYRKSVITMNEEFGLLIDGRASIRAVNLIERLLDESTSSCGCV